MLLSVVIVNWNSKDDLAACLRSLAEQTHHDLEVVVVDNGSTDGSGAMVRSVFPAVRLVESDRNLGFAGGCNRGIAVARASWVCLLNNDAVAEPGWAAAMARAAQAAPDDAGMLQSLMVYMARPRIVNSTGIQLRRNGSGIDRGDGQPRELWRSADEIFCPTGGAAAYRRSMLDAVRLSSGWLDESHFLYYEDLDLGWRARLAGWSARYVPDAVVHHRWHGSSDRHGQAFLRQLAETNRLRTLLKNASPELLVASGYFSARGLVRVARDGGRAGTAAFLRAAREALDLRPAVTALCRYDRRDIERRWAR
jgi:GT2 family glycosyltransferase